MLRFPVKPRIDVKRTRERGLNPANLRIVGDKWKKRRRSRARENPWIPY